MSENRTLEYLKESWSKDVGYLRIANELQLDPDMVKELYMAWTKESMDTMGLGN